jgi:hypothetical protein
LLGVALVSALALQAGCGVLGNRADREPVNTPPAEETLEDLKAQSKDGRRGPSGTIWDALGARKDQGQVGAVNKYIWNAALETLEFLPVQSVDPFTGVITTGYGTPPGGGRAYRATIFVSDPALDARSLNVSLQTRSGQADAATTRAIEDAILTRARQLRARDSRI